MSATVPFELALPAYHPAVRTPRRVRGSVHGLPADGAPPQPWVLLVHGYLAHRGWGFLPALTDALLARGLAVVAFDLSGGGFDADGVLTEVDAFAHNTYGQELEDVAAVAEHARGIAGLDPDRAGLWGHSRGTGMALLHAAACPRYCALCLWAAVARVGRYGPPSLAAFRRDGHLLVPVPDGRELRLERDLIDELEAEPERFDVERAAERVDAPVRLVRGARDGGVSRGEQETLLARLPRAELVEIEGVGHNFGWRASGSGSPPPLREALATTVDWFARHLGAGGAAGGC